MRIQTFSIVAYDPTDQAFGVGVASKFLAVGAAVPWARAGVGAVATQAMSKITFGPDGLERMARGISAADTLAALLAADPGREHRQAGMVDAQGQAAAHTGRECMDYAGHRIGDGFTCQGNILAGPGVLDAMVEAYQSSRGELGRRLLAALQAADAQGGDRRGKQAAAILVVKPSGGYGGDNDRYMDLRVDDDPEPLRKLANLVAAHHVFFGTPRAEDAIPIDETLARELQGMMRDAGYYQGDVNGTWDDGTIRAFSSFIGAENLEERWSADRRPDHIDRVALDYLRQRLGAR
jgi:uncharacterized Ntn-hydrolase superfamily protein